MLAAAWRPCAEPAGGAVGGSASLTAALGVECDFNGDGASDADVASAAGAGGRDDDTNSVYTDDLPSTLTQRRPLRPQRMRATSAATLCGACWATLPWTPPLARPATRLRPSMACTGPRGRSAWMSTCATSTHERGCWGAACGIRTDDDDDDPYVECELTPASLGGKLHALMYTPE